MGKELVKSKVNERGRERDRSEDYMTTSALQNHSQSELCRNNLHPGLGMREEMTVPIVSGWGKLTCSDKQEGTARPHLRPSACVLKW